MYCRRGYKVTCKGCEYSHQGRDCQGCELNGYENSTGRMAAQYSEGHIGHDELLVILPDIVTRMSWAVGELSDLQVDFPEWYEQMKEQVEVLDTCVLLLKEIKK